jgi:NitT/TauT family transport system permease protein
MVVILSIFPIVVNTEAGLREVDPLYLETAHAFRASWWQQFHMVVLRASAPSIVSGLRLGIAGAIAGAVVGEFFGAYSGLGFLVVQYSNAFRTADTMAIVIVLALIGLVANAVLRRVEIALSPWRTTKRAGAE